MLIMRHLKKNLKQSNTAQNDLIYQSRQRENLLMIIAFLICWAPFGWVYTIPLLGINETQSSKTTVTSDALPLLTVKLGCAIINPLVYGYENSEFYRRDERNDNKKETMSNSTIWQ